MRIRKIVCAPIAALTLAGSFIEEANGANILVNGSFENSGQTISFVTHTSTGISGWIITDGSVDTVTSDFVMPTEGSTSIDLDGSTPGTIAQTFATIVGQEYSFTIDVLGSNVGFDSADFDITGLTSVFNETYIDETDTLFEFQGSFIADSNSSTLSISSNNINGQNNGGLFLDNAIIVAIPEPSSFVLLGLGGLTMVFKRSRR